MMNYYAQCVADDMKFIYAICWSCYWSRAGLERKKKLCLSSCLVLAIKLNDKEANSQFSIPSLITFASCFNHNSLLIVAAAFFICHINNGSFWFQVFHQQKKKIKKRKTRNARQTAQMKFDTKQIQKCSATCLLHQIEMQSNNEWSKCAIRSASDPPFIHQFYCYCLRFRSLIILIPHAQRIPYIFIQTAFMLLLDYNLKNSSSLL